jgi:hypothetical protein
MDIGSRSRSSSSRCGFGNRPLNSAAFRIDVVQSTNQSIKLYNIHICLKCLKSSIRTKEWIELARIPLL